jgi:uncharacterized glyoxalase superfamily protein PhnB
MKQPDKIGGTETLTAYIIVSDADTLYARAKAAGAEIVLISRMKTTADAVLVAVL